MFSCCDRICIFFLFIGFLQFVLRWQRDERIVSQPWQLYARGNSSTKNSMSSSTIIFNRYANAYGTIPIKVLPKTLIIGDRSEIIMNIHANITAPYKSFHRIVLFQGKYPIQTMSMFISPIGSSSVHMTYQMIHIPNYPISFKHYYDEGDGEAQVSLKILIRSGQYNLWDVKWSDVYIQE